MRITVLATLVALTTSAVSAAQPEDVFGQWLIDTGEAIIEISSCEDSVCGKIVWLEEPKRPDGSIKLDRQNPDPSLQSVQICGMDIIHGFRRQDDKWVDGIIYNPDDGETYSSTMYVNEEGLLHVRGYVGLPLLGKTMLGTRQQDARGGCQSTL